MESFADLDRLTLELTLEEKATIELAARLTGQSTNEFAVAVLREFASTVNEERRLSHEFSETLARPARSVDGLRDLLRRPSVFDDC